MRRKLNRRVIFLFYEIPHGVVGHASRHQRNDSRYAKDDYGLLVSTGEDLADHTDDDRRGYGRVYGIQPVTQQNVSGPAQHAGESALQQGPLGGVKQDAESRRGDKAGNEMQNQVHSRISPLFRIIKW
ncbi:hypothetical protein D3C81_1842070 [compost metagenome]